MNTQRKKENVEKPLWHKKAIMRVAEVKESLAEDCSKLLEEKLVPNITIEGWFLKTKQILEKALTKEGLLEKMKQALHEEIKSLEDFRKFLYVYKFLLEKSRHNHDWWQIDGFPLLINDLKSFYYLEGWKIVEERLDVLQKNALLLVVPISYFEDKKNQHNKLVVEFEDLFAGAMHSYRISNAVNAYKRS